MLKEEVDKEKNNRFALISIEMLEKELKSIPIRKYFQSFITGMEYYIKLVKEQSILRVNFNSKN